MATVDDSIRYGSVCSGIEAVTLAWRPLGLSAAWFAEIDPFACAVLAHHFPQTPNLGDMTRIASQVLSGVVCAPDVLVGGTPCQSFSVAGLRKGLDDSRGALTLKYVELANAIDQVRTNERQKSCIILWENVPGVLSDRDNAFGCFLGTLVGHECELRPAGRSWTHAGCAYGPQRSAAWRVLDAQYFGVAQRRKRVFVVASARNDFDPAAVLFECESLRRDTSPRAQERQDAACAVASGAAPPGQAVEIAAARAVVNVSQCFGGGNHNRIERAACLTAHGPRLDFKTETFAVQAVSGSICHSLTRAHSVVEDGGGRGIPVIAVSYESDGSDWPQSLQPLTLAFAQNSRGELRWESGDGQTTGALSRGGGIPGQGFPTVASATFRGRAQTNASTLKPTGRRSKGYPPLSTIEAHLRCTPRESVVDDGRAFLTWVVRRLMPVECERLQGLPDHYTCIPYRGELAADGPRYAAIGNSMAVPCITWLGQRLLDTLKRTRR